MTRAKASATAPLLPAAAAHYPSNLRKLRRPLLAATKSKFHTPHPVQDIQRTDDVTTSVIPGLQLLAETVDAKVRTHQILETTLLRQRRITERLQLKLHKRQQTTSNSRNLHVKLDLWDRGHGRDVNFTVGPLELFFLAFLTTNAAGFNGRTVCHYTGHRLFTLHGNATTL